MSSIGVYDKYQPEQPIKFYNTTMDDNDANGAGGGGGAYLNYCYTEFYQSRIRVNHTSGKGGGIKFDHGSSIITNCDFDLNSADDLGDVIYANYDGTYAYSTLTFNNSIFWNNDSNEIVIEYAENDPNLDVTYSYVLFLFFCEIIGNYISPISICFRSSYFHMKVISC